MTRLLLLPAMALAGAVAVGSSVVVAGRNDEPAARAAGVGVAREYGGAVPGVAGPAALPLEPPIAGTGRSERARWRWPVAPRPTVLRPFRAPLSEYGAGHRGLDLAVAEGTSVVAVEAGVVTHAGDVAGRGTVSVAHAGGLSSTYEPLDPAVSTGSAVAVKPLAAMTCLVDRAVPMVALAGSVVV